MSDGLRDKIKAALDVAKVSATMYRNPRLMARVEADLRVWTRHQERDMGTLDGDYPHCDHCHRHMPCEDLLDLGARWLDK